MYIEHRLQILKTAALLYAKHTVPSIPKPGVKSQCSVPLLPQIFVVVMQQSHWYTVLDTLKRLKFIKQVKPWKRDPIRHGSDAIMRVGLT